MCENESVRRTMSLQDETSVYHLAMTLLVPLPCQPPDLINQDFERNYLIDLSTNSVAADKDSLVLCTMASNSLFCSIIVTRVHF